MSTLHIQGLLGSAYVKQVFEVTITWHVFSRAYYTPLYRGDALERIPSASIITLLDTRLKLRKGSGGSRLLICKT